MSAILSPVLTVLFTMPFLGLIIAFLVIKLLIKNTRKSVHIALDYTTFFFIISVHFLIVTIWGKSFFWLIILLLILIAMVFVVVHWKVNEEIVLKKVLKGFWRFSFMIFFLAYITLTLFGLVVHAVIFTLS